MAKQGELCLGKHRKAMKQNVNSVNLKGVECFIFLVIFFLFSRFSLSTYYFILNL